MQWRKLLKEGGLLPHLRSRWECGNVRSRFGRYQLFAKEQIILPLQIASSLKNVTFVWFFAFKVRQLSRNARYDCT